MAFGPGLDRKANTWEEGLATVAGGGGASVTMRPPNRYRPGRGPDVMSFDAYSQAVTSPLLRAIAARWGAARGSTILPAWENIDLRALAAEVSLIWVYRYDTQTGRFTGRLAGDRITKGLGKNLRGLPLDDAHSAKDYLWVHRYLTRVVRETMGYRSAGRLFQQAGRFIEGERIALPLAAMVFKPTACWVHRIIAIRIWKGRSKS